MQLARVLQNISVECLQGDLNREITDVVCHDAKVVQGTLFVALRGSKHDGHDVIAQAVERGALAVLVEREVAVPAHVTVLLVPNTHEAYGLAASNWCDNPSQHLTVVGVTGTSGKTTTTYLLESIAVAAGKRVGVIGTVEHRFAGRVFPAQHTTPDALAFQQLLQQMRAAHVDIVFTEVSSHALDQCRVAGTQFDGAVFTNLSPEHLDYHQDLEDYFAAKLRLFTEVLPQSSKTQRFAVTNADDPYGLRLCTLSPIAPLSYGFAEHAMVRCSTLQLSADGSSLTLQGPFGELSLDTHLVGRFNVSNILAAVATAHQLGFSAKEIREGVERLAHVPGRFEYIANERGFDVFVDYAHKPDALEKVLSTAREFTQDRIVLVFGCGGDRDPYKRPLMGEVAGRLADVVVVTSDNPRSEDPRSILQSIVAGLEREMQVFDGARGFLVEEDRRAAIRRALEMARVGDVVIVAGKGHENYQIVGTERRVFDDREEVRAVLE